MRKRYTNTFSDFGYEFVFYGLTFHTLFKRCGCIHDILTFRNYIFDYIWDYRNNILQYEK